MTFVLAAEDAVVHAEHWCVLFPFHHWNIRTLSSLACAAQGSVKPLLSLCCSHKAACCAWLLQLCTHQHRYARTAQSHTRGHVSLHTESPMETEAPAMWPRSALQRWSDPAAAAAGSQELVQGDRRGRMRERDEDKKWQNASDSDGGRADRRAAVMGRSGCGRG